ncbi:tetratricopeptide repeat protein [Pseudomonas frederiksbergensis]|uniref:tetratricopeptide repeat protein n=1 Tax=Pseudomonas frederiksbergensis TaxID=104087 RepID=UPI00223B55DC|nr:sel1 repeat family protein [Pseudomonas frederiksbergensis]
METHTSTFVVFSGKIEPLISIKRIMICALLLTAITNNAYAELNTEQKLAKTKGITLYNQYKAISAIPYLKLAAEGGDGEAMYYLGEAIRKNNRYMNVEAQKAYEDSAALGNIYSMIRLGRSTDDPCTEMNNCPKGKKSAQEWMDIAKKSADLDAERGNSESMYLLYEISGDDKWLEKSAASGFSLAQFRLATKYQEGGGFFLLPSNRLDAIERWMKASAEGGYPPGMMGFAAVSIEKKDLESFRNWNEKAAASGYVEGVFGYGSYLGENPSNYGFKPDLVKSYALLSLLFELDGGGNVRRDVEDVLPDIAKKMSPEQINEAKRFSEGWKSSHPPLSFFPDKL